MTSSHRYVPIWALPRCYELAGNKRWIQQWYTILIRAIWSLQRKPVHWDQALHSLWWSLEKRSGSPIYISIDEKIRRYFGKASVQDERVCVLKMELMETTSLLKREEMTPRLGRSTNVLLIYGQSFFKFKKWSKMSSSFPVRKVVWDFWWIGIFQFRKWSRSNGHFCNENGSMDCWCTIDSDSPYG